MEIKKLWHYIKEDIMGFSGWNAEYAKERYVMPDFSADLRLKVDATKKLATMVVTAHNLNTMYKEKGIKSILNDGFFLGFDEHLTAGDCEDLYEKCGRYAICKDGTVTGFESEK